MMARLHLNFFPRSNFSVLGPDWSVRLDPWWGLGPGCHEVPAGDLILDAKVEDEGTETPVRIFCHMDSERTLHFEGEVP